MTDKYHQILAAMRNTASKLDTALRENADLCVARRRCCACGHGRLTSLAAAMSCTFSANRRRRG